MQPNAFDNSQRSSHVLANASSTAKQPPQHKVIRSLSGCRQQADAPNHASKKTKSQMSLLWFVFSCHALRVLRYSTQFVTRLAAPASCVRAAFADVEQLHSFPVVTLHFTIVELRHPNRISFRFPSVIHFSSSTLQPVHNDIRLLCDTAS